MEPVQIGNASLYHGDAHEIAPSLSDVTALVSDPPYGCRNDCDYTRFSGGKAQSNDMRRGKSHPYIAGDDQPFDPSPWLGYPKVVLFGYPHFADKLPLGTVLVWVKKRDSQLGTFLSDAELAWQKGGRGVYVHRHVWNGFDRDSERGQKTLHPTQKPVAVMRWIIERLKLPTDATVLDPFMGAGATGLACLELGLRFVGIELEPRYFEIARDRIEKSLDC